MSIECRECERDLRGPHAKSCSRYRDDGSGEREATAMSDLHVIKCADLNCCEAVASPLSIHVAEEWAERHAWMSMDDWRCPQHAQEHAAFIGARPAFEMRDGVGTCVEHCLLYDDNRPGKSRARCHIRGRTTVQGAPCHVWVRDLLKKEQRP